jgi:hypothetical protein
LKKIERGDERGRDGKGGEKLHFLPFMMNPREIAV